MATGTSSVSAGPSVAQRQSESKGTSVSQVTGVSGNSPGGSGAAILLESGPKILTETGSPLELESGP